MVTNDHVLAVDVATGDDDVFDQLLIYMTLISPVLSSMLFVLLSTLKLFQLLM